MTKTAITKPDQSNKQNKLTVWFRAFVTLVALSLVGYLLSRENWTEIIELSDKIIGAPLLWALLMMTSSRIFTTLRWHILLNTKEKRIPFHETLKINFSGLFATNFLPSTVGGDVVRLAGGIKAGLGGSFTAASLIVDRMIGMTGMLLFFPIGLSEVLPLLSKEALEIKNSNNLASIPILQPVLEKIKDKLKSVFAAFSIWTKNPMALVYSMILNILNLLMLFGVVWILLSASGEQITFWQVGGLWTFIYLVTLIPISINGLGVQEISITYVFINFGGVDETNALILAIFVRLLYMLLSLPGAFFAQNLVPKITSKKK